MKLKYIILLIICSFNSFGFSSYFKPKPKIRILWQIGRHCESGFGLCVVFGRPTDSPDAVLSELSLEENVLSIKVEKTLLTASQETDFQSGKLIIEEEIIIPDELCGDLETEMNTTILPGNYIVKDVGEYYTVELPVK